MPQAESAIPWLAGFAFTGVKVSADDPGMFECWHRYSHFLLVRLLWAGPHLRLYGGPIITQGDGESTLPFGHYPTLSVEDWPHRYTWACTTVGRGRRDPQLTACSA